MSKKSKAFGEYRPVGFPSMELAIYDQTFKVRGMMAAVRLFDVIQVMEGMSDESEGEGAAKTMMNFLSDAFLTEDRERGMEFLRNSEVPVTMVMLIDIIQWLIEEYTGNPTESSESSSENGSSSDGSGNTESASSAA